MFRVQRYRGEIKGGLQTEQRASFSDYVGVICLEAYPQSGLG